MHRAFSLVELSIVLVILGLLTGGILAGQSLIRAAELRSVSTEFNRYVTATQTFRDKYMALPGDMLRATSFWGDRTECADPAIANGSPGTCNGNGDMILDIASGANAVGEVFLYWQHMALAGLIEGSFSPLAGANGGGDNVINSNAPASRISQAGWSILTRMTPYSAHAELYDGIIGTNLMLGGDTTAATARPVESILKPEEQWALDTKIDDGRPATGFVVVRTRVGCAVAANGAALTSSAADAAKLDSTYNLLNSALACTPIFRNLF